MTTAAFAGRKPKCLGPLGRCWLLLCVAGAGLWPGRCQAAAALRLSEGRNVKVAVYAKGSLTPAATIEANRVFTDHRRMGFFKVRLIPLVVAEGVRLGIAPAAANTDWPASIRLKLAPFARAGSQMECHDLKVCLLPETEPRLQSRQLLLPANAQGAYCVLEGVTLRTGGDLLRLPRARLLLERHPGRVVWEEQGATVQWDLLTANVIHHEINQVNQSETP